MTQPRVGYASGVFDMFHIGHLNVLKRASERCDYLVAGVATDDYVLDLKGATPVVPYEERAMIVAELRCVAEVVPDVSLDKTVAWRARTFDVIFKGDDWRDTLKGEELERTMGELGVDVVYLPYTQRTSSTLLRSYLDAAIGSRT
ncbi:adenylyltransferase/cytidyltransferase family protein [Mumia sp. zg.B21]|uniref:adenylyltransferase/cytidyltransferase family protein n=1 Tax=Mumia sp. zg.B21 TaxID=2855447 RepID=UPI001C6E1E19|nr:adenylyltransferase/cytidyltransferase family protein [Mumia sp. zg.B21]MBW9210758.1 adenylyltransferase/cytidyltransferase family protein [Mumia sp. zg.B21]